MRTPEIRTEEYRSTEYRSQEFRSPQPRTQDYRTQDFRPQNYIAEGVSRTAERKDIEGFSKTAFDYRPTFGGERSVDHVSPVRSRL